MSNESNPHPSCPDYRSSDVAGNMPLQNSFPIENLELNLTTLLRPGYLYLVRNRREHIAIKVTDAIDYIN